MPATNAVLHDKRYYVDGIFCEAPKKIETVVEAAGVEGRASQSRWNTNDYHWEERDLLDFARRDFRDAVLASPVVWSDRSGDSLRFVDATVTGHAASNVRKGRRLLTYDLECAVRCEGRRGGAGVVATLRAPAVAHDDDHRLSTADQVAVECAPTPSEATDEAALIRAMRTHEMLEKVLKKKGKHLVHDALRALLARLHAKGSDMEDQPPHPLEGATAPSS